MSDILKYDEIEISVEYRKGVLFVEDISDAVGLTKEQFLEQ